MLTARSIRRLAAALAAVALALTSSPTPAAAQAPQPVSAGASSCSWLPTFGAQPGTNGPAFALEAFDDGTGPALFVGGAFTFAGSVELSAISLWGNLAKWDGAGWSDVGEFNSHIADFEVFDDGGGPALFACGGFSTVDGATVRGIAKWTGAGWEDVGGGVKFGAEVMQVFDDGNGPALYVGGDFSSAGGVPAPLIARWDGASWASLGSGLVGSDVFALTVFDDGTGPALFVGGDFSTAGGPAIDNVAKWDGSTWAPLGSGVAGNFPGPKVLALEVFDDGGGPALFAGGQFTSAGGVAANYLARWDGASWAPLAEQVDQAVFSLAVFDAGQGPQLYAGGSFTSAGALAVSGVAAWNGAAWSELAGGVDTSVSAFAAYDDGSGPALYSGGSFTTAGGQVASHVARWDGTAWSSLVPDQGLNGSVLCLTTLETQAGPRLVAGGSFTGAGGVLANRVALWDGSGWARLGEGTSGPVYALTRFNAGSGPELYAGGQFFFAGSLTVNSIARWDGAAWQALGSGLGANFSAPEVRALAVFDDGSGARLYAAGDFDSAGGLVADKLARWDGQQWSVVDQGLNGRVHALTVFDDGSGAKLVAGGLFTIAGGVVVNHIAQWNGSSWTALGDSGMNDDVLALAVFDDGAGPALFAGGEFTSAGGIAANRIAKWNGAQWSALGSGLGGSQFSRCHALTRLDDGRGPGLYAGGDFTTAGGVQANGVARWDGSSWSALGSGTTQGVRALARFDGGNGPALFAGGGFGAAPDSGDSYLARWACASAGATSYCTAGSSASGCQATLTTAGTPSASAASGFTLSAAGAEGAKQGLFFFGTNGRQASPWGNGTSFQCVLPPVVRTGLLAGAGNAGTCDGSFDRDLNALWCPSCPKAHQNPGAGAQVQAQLWYRDPFNTSNQTTSLSDAIEFELAP